MFNRKVGNVLAGLTILNELVKDVPHFFLSTSFESK